MNYIKSSEELKLKLLYQDTIKDQDIRIKKLRPKGSYDYLIANRNYPLQTLLNKNGIIEDRYLMVRTCPLCRSKEYELQFVKDHFNIISCKKCSLIYVNPILTPEVYENIYRSNEYIDIMKKLGEESHDYRKKRFGVERVDNIEKFLSDGPPKKLLEIVCSTGFMLEVPQERGWEAIGLELNPSAVAFGRARGLNIIDQPIEEIDFGVERFSAIAMYDVLEHLVYPDRMVNQVRDLLLNGGSIYIYVPNYQSASKHLLRIENSHIIWPTHHLTYFTPITLRNFLENHGFEILYWETQGLDIEDWLWYLKEKTDYDTELIEKNKTFLQFVINASEYGKNLRMYARKVSYA